MLPVWVRTLRFTLILPGTVTVVIPTAIVATTGGPDAWPPTGWAWLGLGLAPIALGLGLYAWTAWSFATRGRGTPAPWDAPRKLVTTGPYAVSRNPMYVAVVGVVLGEAVLMRSAWLLGYAALVALAFHTRTIVYEERVLTELFGDEYRAYCGRTPRWIGPRSRARTGQA